MCTQPSGPAFGQPHDHRAGNSRHEQNSAIPASHQHETQRDDSKQTGTARPMRNSIGKAPPPGKSGDGKPHRFIKQRLRHHCSRKANGIDAELRRPQQSREHQPEPELDQRGEQEGGGHQHASLIRRVGMKGKAPAAFTHKATCTSLG